MKKRVLAILITCCMALALLPAAALAADGLTIAAATEAELMAALAKTERVDAINITDSFTITGDCRVKYNADTAADPYLNTVVTIAAGKTLTVGDGGQFSVAWYTWEGDWSDNPSAAIVNNGAVSVESGGLIDGDFGTNNGVLTVKRGGTVKAGFKNTGTGIVTVEAGGLLGTTQGGGIDNEGVITVAAGTQSNGSDAAVLASRMGGRINNKSGGTLNMSGNLIIGGGWWDDDETDGDPAETEHAWFGSDGTIGGTGGFVCVGYSGASDGTRAALGAAFPGRAILDGAPVYTEQALYDVLVNDGGCYDSYRIMADITVPAARGSSYAGYEKNLVIDGSHGSLTVDGAEFYPKFLGGYGFVNGGLRDPALGAGPEKGIITARNGAQVGFVTLNAGTIAAESGGSVSFGGTGGEPGKNGGAVVVRSGGTLSTAQGTTLENSGTITVEAGGTLISRMGGTIENKGTIAAAGTFSISDPGSWDMLGKFRDNGGTITGTGVINIANSDLALQTDADTFASFAGTVKYYAASVTTQEELTAALATDRPFIFITNVDSPAANREQVFTVCAPTAVIGRALILCGGGSEFVGDGWTGGGSDYNYRSIDIAEGGSLTLVNSTYTCWMEGGAYSVSIGLNGGTLQNWTPFPNVADCTASTADITLPAPTRAGYVFAGWKLERFGKPDAAVPAGAFDITDGEEGYFFAAQWAVPYDPPAGETIGVGGSAVQVTVSGGQASLTLGEVTPEADGAVTIDVTSAAGSVDAVTLGAGSMDQLARTEAPVTVKLTGGELTFDAGAVAAIAERSGGAPVRLSVAEADRSAFGADVKAIIGDRPVFELNLSSGGTEIHELGGTAVVTLPYTPRAGENPGYVVVWRMVSGLPQPIACRYDAAAGTVSFETGTFSAYVVASFPFADVPMDAWYYADAAFAYSSGLIKGTGEGAFSPNVTATRGMIVTILWRMEGKPAADCAVSFGDVSAGAYYAEAVAWAAANKIVEGYTDSAFGPEDPITREQMAAILYRCAKYKGWDVSAGEDTDILSYADAESVSGYASDAMQWACGAGLIRGSGNRLMPGDGAARAQAAAILTRFCRNAAK